MFLSACVARSLDDAESESTDATATVTSSDDAATTEPPTTEPPTTGGSAPTSGSEASAGSGAPPEPMTSTTTTTEPMTTGPVTTSETSATTDAPVELDCESYCELYEAGCEDFSEYANTAECLSQCAQWPVGEPNQTASDSLGCRTYHVTVAGTIDPVVHCPHAGPSGAGVCVDPNGPQCHSYCDTYFSACVGTLNSYASEDDCMAQCAAWYPGVHHDTTGDSVGCRTFHATAALEDAPVHCPHAGPSGGNVCETQQ